MLHAFISDWLLAKELHKIKSIVIGLVADNVVLAYQEFRFWSHHYFACLLTLRETSNVASSLILL